MASSDASRLLLAGIGTQTRLQLRSYRKACQALGQLLAQNRVAWLDVDEHAGLAVADRLGDANYPLMGQQAVAELSNRSSQC